ncbi:MAG: glycosyltransferase family 2 protein [Erysipelotrichaceae bacterium]|nr:glycosyltransferase family 2 protein [Erysipelotrichaceae bacterium]
MRQNIVSVIVPVYNTSPYLDQCFDSLVRQTLKDIEFIIIDDGSTDDSWEIIQKYVNKYPDRFFSYKKTNGGLSSARNYGLQYARGTYIGFVDSDDWVEENMFETLYTSAISTDATLIICNMQVVDQHQTIPYLYTKQKDIKAHVTSVCNKLFHYSLFQQLHFTENIHYEDLEILMRMLPQIQQNQIQFCDKILYNYRKTEGSIMTKPNALKNLDMIIVFENAFAYFSQQQLNFDSETYIKDLWLEHVTITTITRLIKQNGDHTNDVIHKLNAYAKKHFKRIFQSVYFKQLPLKRKIIAFLNGHNFIHISSFLLKK